MTAPMVLDGAMHGVAFLAYVEHVLVPSLAPGDIVVMDNLPAHKPVAVRQAIDAAGAELRFLPPYSPDFNPIEMAFSKPLAGWELPDAFPTLRRLLEARRGKAGKREYVQVLRLLETFDLEVLHGAVKDALRLGAIGYDAVKHLVLCRIERRPPKLDLDIYPYLPRANVATTAAASYMSLLGGGAS